MANRVLILRWAGSAYDSLGGLLELTAHELAAQGLEVTMCSADGKDWPQRLIGLLKQGGVSFALTFRRARRRTSPVQPAASAGDSHTRPRSLPK